VNNKEVYLERLLDSLEGEFRELLSCRKDMGTWAKDPAYAKLLGKIERFGLLGLHTTVVDTHVMHDSHNLRDAAKVVNHLVNEAHSGLLHVNTHDALTPEQFEQSRKCVQLLGAIKATLKQINGHL